MTNRVPDRERIAAELEELEETGIYLHIPFCRQICPYCPYNKEVYTDRMAARYVQAVNKEIAIYGNLLGRMPVTSFYIGGGTPTTMLHSGMDSILEHAAGHLNLQCDIHMECHPNDLDRDGVAGVRSLGVNRISLGIESLHDRHLRVLHRPYTAEAAEEAISRAVGGGFDCVNVDMMFDLPQQSNDEIMETAARLVDLNVDQVAAYPLFRFPYTRMGGSAEIGNYRLSRVIRRRHQLRLLETVFYGAGFTRSSVWAFTRRGVPRYCSVTVPVYIGLGASGGSYLHNCFYLNTFNVREYIEAMNHRGSATALSMDIPRPMQMAGWLYWRFYETTFSKQDFRRRFGVAFDSVYGRWMCILGLLGFLTENRGRIVLTDRGAYWLHALEDVFSLDYVGTLWGTSKQNPWPAEVVL